MDTRVRPGNTRPLLVRPFAARGGTSDLTFSGGGAFFSVREVQTATSMFCFSFSSPARRCCLSRPDLNESLNRNTSCVHVFRRWDYFPSSRSITRKLLGYGSNPGEAVAKDTVSAIWAKQRSVRGLGFSPIDVENNLPAAQNCLPRECQRFGGGLEGVYPPLSLSPGN